MKLKNKRIVITGGTSGIGYEIAKTLSIENEVIVISRNSAKLEKLSQELEGVITFHADLSKIDDVEMVADAIVKRFDSLDVLINNAAIQNTPTFLDDNFSYKNISREVTVNFTSICCLTYLLLPLLIHENETTILNVNSGLALAPKTTSAIYCSTKGALNIFSQSLRYQLEDTNIHVQQAFLELVDTEMTKGRGKKKMSAKSAALKIIYGIEHHIVDHDFGKVKLLRMMLRLAPSTAHKIMKNY